MEPVTSLLDAFIKLADRLINFEKTKLQNKQTVFNEIIKPLFEELEPVASNYMGFFQKARQMVTDSKSKDLLKVAIQLRNDRDTMVMARIKVKALASQIPRDSTINDPETSIRPQPTLPTRRRRIRRASL